MDSDTSAAVIRVIRVLGGTFWITSACSIQKMGIHLGRCGSEWSVLLPFSYLACLHCLAFKYLFSSVETQANYHIFHKDGGSDFEKVG